MSILERVQKAIEEMQKSAQGKQSLVYPSLKVAEPAPQPALRVSESQNQPTLRVIEGGGFAPLKVTETPLQPEISVTGAPPSPEPKPLLQRVQEGIARFAAPSPKGVRPQDVAREIPQAIGETGKKVAGFAKDILQGITRSGGSVGLTLARKDELPIDSSSPKWQQKAQEIIFGKEPVKSLSMRIAEGELRIQPYLKKVGAEKASLPVSFVGIALLTGLDFTGAGGQKNVLKVLAKTDDVGFIAKTLRQIGVQEDLILPAASKIKTISNEKEIKTALDKISELQKMTKVAPETAKAIPPDLQPIAQGIKKPPIQAVEVAKDVSISEGGISFPYISASVKAPTDIGRQSLTILSNIKAAKPELVDSLLNISPSNLKKDAFVIQNYSSIVKKISQETQKSFQSLLQEATGIMPDVRIKSFDSFAGKIKRYLLNKKNPTTIVDNLAGRIIVNSSDIETTLKNVQNNFRVEEIQNFFQNPTEWGYKGINIKVKLPNDLLSEIQIHTPESLKIATQIHKIYEKWRNFDLSKLTKAQKVEFLVDIKKSKEISQAAKETKTLLKAPIAKPIESQLAVQSSKEVADEAIKFAKANPESSLVAKEFRNKYTKELESPPAVMFSLRIPAA